MVKIVDRAQMTVLAAPGTGSVPLGPASPGMRVFSSAGIVDNDVVPYVIECAGGAVWEIGHGTYKAGDPPYLFRTTILSTSNGNTSPINATVDAIVYIAVHADEITTLTNALDQLRAEFDAYVAAHP